MIRFLYEGCLFPPPRADSSPAEASVLSSSRMGARDPDRSTKVGSSSAIETRARGEGVAGSVGTTASAAVAESSLGPRCKKRQTRRAAFALLAALCQEEETHLRQTLVLLGGRDLVKHEIGVFDRQSEMVSSFRCALETDAGEEHHEGAAGSGSREGLNVSAQSGDQERARSSTGGGEAGVGSGEPWDYDPMSVLKESGQHVGLQNQVRSW